MLPYITAILVAAVVGIVEQYKRVRARRTLRNQAWIWWLGRITLEAVVAVIALRLLRETDMKASKELWGWIAAGAAGPAALRLRILDFGRGEDARPIGVATAYEPVRGFIEEQIDKRSAERQANWINQELLPVLERAEVEPAVLATYVIDYLRSLSQITPARREFEIDFIEQIRDGPEKPHVKREQIVKHAAFELGAFRLLDQFAASAGEES